MSKQASLDDILEELQVAVVTRKQIEALLEEAIAAGDETMARIARAALGERDVPGVEARFEHPVDARDECVRVIAGRRASQPDSCPLDAEIQKQ